MAPWFERLWDRLYADYLQRLEVGQWSQFVQHVVDSLLVLALAVLLVWLSRLVHGRLLKRVQRVPRPTHRRKLETVASLVSSIVKYTIFIAGLLWVLALWGVNTPSLIVGSAVLGAAVGFGSQGLIQDLITGLSILAEEQLAVGDFVEVAGKTGAVEEIGLRVVKLRDHLGVQHVIFNRNISMVSNYGGGAQEALVDLGVKDRETAARAQQVAVEAGTELAAELPYFVGPPEFVGLVDNSLHETYLRLKVRVLPLRDYAIREFFVARVEKALAAAGLPIPEGRVRIVLINAQFRKLRD